MQQTTFRRAALSGFVLAFVLSTFAAAADTGTITGRVLNPATGEYVRNAEVTARNGALIAVTDENGY